MNEELMRLADDGNPNHDDEPHGIAAIIGKWPGDETDEQIDELMGWSTGPASVPQWDGDYEE